MAAAAWIALALPASAQDALAPFNELADAKRDLARKKNPASLESVAASSASQWAREQAQRTLADHYAAKQQWTSFKKHQSAAGPCALLRFELVSAAKPSAAAVNDALAAYISSGKGDRQRCIRALAEASATASIDRPVWHAIRKLVSARKSSRARSLLSLLNETRVSAKQFNRAVQRATRTISAKKIDASTQTKQELLGVSAIVAAHSKPVLAAKAWHAISKQIDPEISAQVWVRIAREAAIDHHASALAWFRNAPLGSPSGSLAAHDRFDLAWRTRAALRAGDWTEVKKTIEHMTGEQRELSAWKYWHAIAVGKTSESKSMLLLEQIADNHDDYYGILAHEHLGRALPVGNSRPNQRNAAQLAEEDADVRLALALAKDGEEGTARKVWQHWSARNSSQAVLAAAEAARAAGWTLGAINAADRASPKSNSLTMRFPTPHSDLIDKYSARFDLNPAFVYGLMRQESRFNASAISSAGARGIMQVMPSTAHRIARRHKYTRYRLPRLTLPETNIILGTTYLRDLADSIGDDQIVIAAAYNAGPSRIRRWIRSSRGISRAILVETIPFTETRIYVKSLLANQVHYSRVLGSDHQPLTEFLAGNF